MVFWKKKKNNGQVDGALLEGQEVGGKWMWTSGPEDMLDPPTNNPDFIKNQLHAGATGIPVPTRSVQQMAVK